MTNHIRPAERGEFDALDHVTLLARHTDPQLAPAGPESQLAAYQRIEREIIHAVRKRGGLVLQDEGSYAQHDAVFAFNDNAYTQYPSPSYAAQQHERLLARVPNLRMPATTNLLDAYAQSAEFNRPYVLANTKDNNGYGKFLIETPEQHAKVMAYAAYRHESARGIQVLAGFAVREYVETPSDHFTSYRVVATPQNIVAAGLLYSAHKKSEAKIVNVGSSELTSPDSPFYLASRDVRSNVNLGGTVIPLMGEGREYITSEEREILAAHNIDPDNPNVPRTIREQTPSISHIYGRVTDLHYGIDFIGDGVYLECNSGPGLRTYEACHVPAGATPDYGVIYAAIYNQVLTDMHTEH